MDARVIESGIYGGLPFQVLCNDRSVELSLAGLISGTNIAEFMYPCLH